MTSRGGGIGLAMGNIVDVESEILGHTRDNTRCPSGKYLPKEGAIEEGGSGAIY